MDDRVKQAFFIVEPDQNQLVQIGKLFDAARLQTVVDAVVPLSETPAAFTGSIRERLGRGKLVATLTAAENVLQ